MFILLCRPNQIYVGTKKHIHDHSTEFRMVKDVDDGKKSSSEANEN